MKSIGTSIILTLSLTGFIACTSSSTASSQNAAQQTTQAGHQLRPHKIGDQVPANLVCMVNDMYMEKEQLKVLFEGKRYYGCCEMCRERIPKDPEVRYAIDPYTRKKVDKAKAYIVLINDDGEVGYFESNASMAKFKSTLNR